MAELDVESVRKLLREQFPHWADLALAPFKSSGTDHLLFRLGSEKVVRFPANAEAAQNIPMHAQWMPRFAALPLQTPQILGTARPDSSAPFAWTVLNWIDGVDAATASISDWPLTVEILGRFVRELRLVDTSGGLVCGQHNAWRGSPLSALDRRTRAAIDAVSDTYDRRAMLAVWSVALSAPEWCGGPLWVHGDIHAANMIVRDGQIVGIIDFGLMALGDPACDLAVGWSFIPTEFREPFFDATQVDQTTRQRGKGWGLYIGVIAYSHYRDKNPVLARIAANAIEAVLADC